MDGKPGHLAHPARVLDLPWLFLFPFGASRPIPGGLPPPRTLPVFSRGGSRPPRLFPGGAPAPPDPPGFRAGGLPPPRTPPRIPIAENTSKGIPAKLRPREVKGSCKHAVYSGRASPSPGNIRGSCKCIPECLGVALFPEVPSGSTDRGCLQGPDLAGHSVH